MKAPCQCGLHALTTEQLARVSIVVARVVYKDAAWRAWASKWLAGDPVSRTVASACMARLRAEEVAVAARKLRTASAAWAASHAACACMHWARSAGSAVAASRVMTSAANAVARARDAGANLDLHAVIRSVLASA